MPKEKASLSERKAKWIKDLDFQDFARLDGSKLICQPCQKGYSFSQRGELEQHSKTATHVQNVHRYKQSQQRQPLIPDAINPSNSFAEELCEAFIAADISLSKLDNAVFYNFLEKHMKRAIPSRQTVARCLPKIHENVLEKIREQLGESHFWVQVDDTTDAMGRFIAIVIIGSLNKDVSEPGHLVLSRPICSTNHATIIQAVLESFQVLWPGRKQEEIDEKFLLLLTDGVNYMKKAGNVLKATYPGLIHVTCLSHALHLVAEQVRANSPLVDKLISSLKKVFKKAPSRVLAYKEMNPELRLPPNAVITRWGTWLKTAEFYAKYFENVKAVVETFDPAEAECIAAAQDLMEKQSVVQELSYISANFTFLNNHIADLQQRGASISSSLNTFNEVHSKLRSVKGSIGCKVLKKMDYVISKNSDLVKAKAFSKVINGDQLEAIETAILTDFSPAKVACFKFAPMTTVDAERSFSMHKNILSARRRRFTVENLEMDVVSHSYYANV